MEFGLCTISSHRSDHKSRANSSSGLFLLASNIAPTPSLKTNDDVCDLHVPFFLQVGKDPCSEEHFTLAHPVEVGV